MDQNSKKNNIWISAIVGLIFIGGVVGLLFSRLQSPVTTYTPEAVDTNSTEISPTEEVTKGDSKPFWAGTEKVQVCRVPYYTSEDCMDLDVTLVNGSSTQILLPDGEYKLTNNLTCYGGNGRRDEPKYVFCRSWDSNNKQWDFFPIWVRI